MQTDCVCFTLTRRRLEVTGWEVKSLVSGDGKRCPNPGRAIRNTMYPRLSYLSRDTHVVQALQSLKGQNRHIPQAGWPTKG